MFYNNVYKFKRDGIGMELRDFIQAYQNFAERDLYDGEVSDLQTMYAEIPYPTNLEQIFTAYRIGLKSLASDGSRETSRKCRAEAIAQQMP